MTKADQLGESAAFDDVVPRRRSARRELIDQATGVPTEEPVAAARGVPLDQLAHNPFNPRATLTEIAETADSLLERGQIQPITIITRQAFLIAHPDAEERIGTATFVVVDGNRRLAAARMAGLEELRVDVNDDLAETAADLLESSLVANIQREDLSPLEEARALSQLVDTHGSLRQVARRVGKSHVWVGQRLALLNLTPQLQEKVENREIPIEDARALGKLPQEQQGEKAAKLAARRSQPDREPESGNGVNTPRRSPAPTARRAPDGGNGVNTSTFDWRDLDAVARALRDNLTTGELTALIALLSQDSQN